MLTEEKRRKIARQFLEENFGKRTPISQELMKEWLKLKDVNTIVTLITMNSHNFELWRNYESIKPNENQARAFDIFYSPYKSENENPVIAVGESYEEVKEIAKLIIPEDRLKQESPNYEEYKGYYIMYD